MANACGREKSCRRNSFGRLLSWLLRVTNMPAASEIRKAGTWVTSPSPMVSVVNSLPASPRLMPAWTMPMNNPPTILIRMMMMPAMASPRTNLLAPSIAPKKSACWVISCRRCWASRSSIDAGVQVGVDGHLLAGHAVEGESGGHLADARGPLGDDHELDHDDDREDDQADHDIVGAGGAAGDELAEGSHHAARRQQAVAARPG